MMTPLALDLATDPASLAAYGLILAAFVFLIVGFLRLQAPAPRDISAPPPSAIAGLLFGLAKTRDKLGLAIRRALGREISQATIDELEQALLEADVGVGPTQAILDRVSAAFRDGRARTPDALLAELKKDILDSLESKGTALRQAASGPTVILVVGVNGAGKTTSVAKLTTILKASGQKVLLAAGDTFRAAAVEQLKIWSERTGVDIVMGQTGGDPASVAFDATEAAIARKVDYLIVDTAGRLHTAQNLMAELAKIKRVIQKRIPLAPHEVILVLDATTGQNAIAQAREFTRATEVTGLFLAKLDGTAKGGIVLAIKEQLDIPVKFVGLGEKPTDIEAFDPVRFVEALFA